jgi:cytochrome c-type biogenesis protein CcmE
MLSVVLVAVAFLLFKFLTSATMYFCDADQVGVKSECSGDKRFRLRGAVVEGTVKNTADGVDFDVMLNGKTIHVQHTGSPPQLFREGIQVVVEGRLVADAPATFASDQLLVKHGEEYRKKNPGRVPADAP